MPGNNLKISEIREKSIWENFLSDREEKTFLSSWNWGEFQKLMGNKIWRLGIFKSDGELFVVALAVKIQARRGTFLFVPHGPVIIRGRVSVNLTEDGSLSILLEKLKEIAKEEKCDFIRIAPIWERNEENIKVFKNLGFRKAPIHIHPELTWELNITPSEDELLMGMRKTTRYLIRQAQKNKDIKLKKSSDLKDIEKFNQLEQATVNRHHFAPFSLEYLKNEFSAFSSDNQVMMFLGKYRDEIVSGGIFVFWQGIGFYHHGASSLKYSKIPLSYLMLWEAIKEAKNRGCKKFNFWGIAPINSKFKQHPWAGLTLFKMGFGGYKKEYVKTQDLPLSNKYWLNYIVERLRKTKRGL